MTSFHDLSRERQRLPMPQSNTIARGEKKDREKWERKHLLTRLSHIPFAISSVTGSGRVPPGNRLLGSSSFCTNTITLVRPPLPSKKKGVAIINKTIQYKKKFTHLKFIISFPHVMYYISFQNKDTKVGEETDCPVNKWK